MRTTIGAAILLIASLLLLVPPPPASAGGLTCRGQVATHVGTPGEALVTTSGPDVVVSNGAWEVQTLGGDDVICATGRRFVSIVPGADDDLVDAGGFTGTTLTTALGDIEVEGSSGDDVYLGGPQVDQVFVWTGTADDHKEVDLRSGNDYLNVSAPYLGQVTGGLGRGKDDYWNDRLRTGSAIDGEQGIDTLVTECAGCRSVEILLRPGAITVDGEASGRAVRFENADVFPRAGVVRRAVIIGTGGDNSLDANACRSVIRGLAGDDSAGGGAFRKDDCERNRAVVFGGDGDDRLRGLDGDDVLRGGPGRDEAEGQAGRDLCRAETETTCER